MDRDFLEYHLRKLDHEKMESFARYLGVQFTAGEIRQWGGTGKGRDYLDADPILMPLTLALRPELQQALIKMVGGQGVPLPAEYQRGKNEVVVDLGKVTPDEFMAFFKNKQASAAPAP